MPIEDYLSKMADKAINYIFNPKNLDALRYPSFGLDMNALEQSGVTKNRYPQLDKKGSRARIERTKR